MSLTLAINQMTNTAKQELGIRKFLFVPFLQKKGLLMCEVFLLCMIGRVCW